MAKKRPSGDGLVRKRGDGRWEARIVVGQKSDGKPIYRSVFAEKQSDLMPKLARLKEQYAGVYLTEDSSLTLGEWLEKWMEEYKKPLLRQSTYTGYWGYIRNHIQPYLGSKRLTQIKTSDLQRLYNRLKESGRKSVRNEEDRGLSNATVRGIHNILHDALDCAVKEGIIANNPTEGTAPPKIVAKEKRVLRRDELEKFIKELEGDEIWYDFFYTAIMTGMRQGEICALRWEDFDEKNGTLRVAHSVDYLHGKPVIGETKTEEGKRTIYLPDSLWRVLSLRKQKALGAWVFPHPTRPEDPLNPSTAYLKLKKLLKKADLPSIRFHDLRHTFTSHAASSGIEPKTLSEIVGHTKASFTLDTYAHVTSDMQKSAANIVTNYITDILGKELKPWENAETRAKER